MCRSCATLVHAVAAGPDVFIGPDFSASQLPPFASGRARAALSVWLRDNPRGGTGVPAPPAASGKGERTCQKT
eukprot:2095568-Pyramimonas_sp.AAC.1